MNEKYAYHIISENFVGNIIYPLSELKNIHPEIANKAAEKYIGREKNVENIVYNPDVHINFDWGKDIVRWNDVSFFTLHNPKRVFETFKELNIPIKKKWRVAKIPIQNFSKRTIVWKHTDNFTNVLPSTDCQSINDFFELTDLNVIPQKAKDYYLQAYKLGKQPLLYAYIPHLLTPDPVSFNESDIFEIDLG